MKLRFRILLSCIVCVLLALLIQTFLFKETSSEMIYNLSREESENSLKNMQEEIYQFTGNMEKKLIKVYGEQDLINALKDESYTIERLRNDFYRKAYDVGAGSFETSDKVMALYLYTADHELISTYRKATTPKHNYPVDIYEDMEAYNAGKVQEYVDSDETALLISGYYNTYREKDIIRFVLKLYNNSNRERKIGYVVCDVDSKVFTDILEKYCTENTMYIWLQSDSDRPIVSRGSLSEVDDGIYQVISGQIQAGNQASIESKSTQELFQAEQRKYNLTAYSLMPESILQQNQRALSLNLVTIAVVMVIVSVALIFIVSSTITKPLDMLMQTIKRIAGGEMELRANVTKKDEIGELGRNFNVMLDQVEELKEKENQANLLLVQAQYKALQAQINPHFLYNTLDTMSSIAEVRNCPEVSMLSQSLSNIFRYSLNMKEPFSTVAKEIVHLKNYCYVMNVRMQDNVQYDYDIDSKSLQARVPKICVQPLVENALNHGLRNKRGEKRIRIEAKVQGELLEICVSDNGVGMDAEKMNESLRHSNLDYVERGNSIGIHNINARLKILYGEEYGLRIESIVGEGTKVRMVIPKIEGEQENE
ncbi:sensor histidine kinase [bacterium 1XD8-76]|nr:sensor histidine kinase [bacterium 1XD8-76]